MNKQTKKLKSGTAAPAKCNLCRGHKIWAAVALVGLFSCGLAVGWALKTDAHTSDKDAAVITSPDILDQNIIPACQVIEDLLAQEVFVDAVRVEDFLSNARVYYITAARGCPENTEKFKAMALRELEIADALLENTYITDDTAVNVISTYKKLNMQREAQEFLNKLQKLTDPAIEFIMKMENIINE